MGQEASALWAGPGVMRDCSVRGSSTAFCLDSVPDAAQVLQHAARGHRL